MAANSPKVAVREEADVIRGPAEVRPPRRQDVGRVELGQPAATPGLVALWRLWSATRGSLSVDLRRQVMPRSAQASLLTVRKQAERRGGGATRRSYAVPRSQFASAAAPSSQQRPAHGEEPPTVAFSDSGARVKLMRHVQFGPEFECVRGGVARTAPSLDLGVGFEFEFDTAELRPKARLKFRDFFSIRALPEPAVRLQKRLELGTSGYGVRVSYECPLAEVANFWEPPARLMVSVDNAVASGLRLTQQGVEFNETLSMLGGDMVLRGRGTLTFPCELPVVEGQELFGWDIKRLGVKTVW